MSKIIITIHGRSNKPEEKILRKGWKDAIEEGLQFSHGNSLGAVEVEMAFYADIYYKDKLYKGNENEEPYKKAKKGSIKRYQMGIMDRLRARAGDWIDSPLDWLEEHSNVFSSLARTVAKKVLKDLGEYYTKPAIRDKINNTLKDLLLEHKDDEIILVSHSMGAIVAYEVLRELGQSRDFQGFTLEHFITMGAPLGLTPVQGNILGNHNNRLRTPSCVKGSWVNFSDPQDFVCLDTHLADDYKANSSGVQVKDMLICNDYPDNPHKSYGYLRTPEFSEHLLGLL